jgi:hypothetical protein
MKEQGDESFGSGTTSGRDIGIEMFSQTDFKGS